MARREPIPHRTAVTERGGFVSRVWRQFLDNALDRLNSRIEVLESNPGGSGAVDSVNGTTGVVVLKTDDISDAGETNKYVTTVQSSLINSAIQPGSNITELTNNAGFVTSALQSGDNVSELVNDAGYLTELPTAGSSGFIDLGQRFETDSFLNLGDRVA